MLVNSIFFNIAWFGYVFFGNNFIPMILGWLVFHLIENPSRKSELIFIVLVTAIGSFVDSVLMHFGVFIFKQQSVLIPVWMIFIWLSFTLTINGYLAFLQKSIALQLFAGLILVPLSYFAANALNAVTFGYSDRFTFIILSLVWAILVPFIYYLNQLIRAKYHAQYA